MIWICYYPLEKGLRWETQLKKVKEIAADICESVTDDGIYYYLKKPEANK